MSARNGLALVLLALAALFFIANRAAYQGYFQDDDLDTLGWTRHAPPSDYLKALVSPVVSTSNFRPTGHGYYRILQRFAGLSFKPYVAVLQILHFLSAALVLFLLRNLGFKWVEAVCAMAVFLFHPATFAAHWQPMYVFDVLCGVFAVACVLAYRARRWVLALICFWLAFKSKELAIMLPVVLFFYELWLGDRRFRRLIPFVCVSLLFGLQALAQNSASRGNYALNFSLDALAETVPHYLGWAFGNPWAGLLVLVAAPLLVRDRRLWFALAAGCSFAFPLLFLPGRQFPVYVYAPLAFLVIAIASVASLSKVARIAVPVALAAIWMPWTYLQLREYRKSALTIAGDNRAYVSALADFLRTAPATKAFILDSRPAGLNHWGMTGAIASLSPVKDRRVATIDSPEAAGLLQEHDLAILSWNGYHRRLTVIGRSSGEPFRSYVSVFVDTPIWQLGEGWYESEGGFRWTAPVATAIVMRPASASQFEVKVNVGFAQLARAPSIHLQVFSEGARIGTADLTTSGLHVLRWTVPPQPFGVTRIEFRAEPPLRPDNDPRVLGVAVESFGWVP